MKLDNVRNKIDVYFENVEVNNEEWGIMNINDEEHILIENEYMDISIKLLNDYGPEGAFKISQLLEQLANDDINNFMNNGYR